MKVPLYEQIYNYVLDEIRSGRLKPGDRVLSEKELGIHFQVSRITSKKALEKLTQDQVIERVRGKGSFVSRAITPERLQSLGASTAAPSLPTQPASRRIVALLLPDFAESYGLRLVKAIEERLRECGYYLLVYRTGGDRDEEERAIETCQHIGVDGMIVFPVHGEYYNARLLRLVLDRFPLVLVDRYLKGIPACSVYTDNRKAASTLTSYLLSLGHQHIAFISPPSQGTSAIEERVQGITASLSEKGLSFSAEDCLDSLYSTLPGAFQAENIAKDEQTLLQYLDLHPGVTAFVTCEYDIAQILLFVLQSIGRRVPEDISIACFDSPEDTLGAPQFTHIRQDEHTIGRTAVDRLLAQINGEVTPLQNIIDFSLVIGKSTRPAG